MWCYKMPPSKYLLINAKKTNTNAYIYVWLFFPTCQVRVVRFYLSCLLLLLSSSSPPPRLVVLLLSLSSSSRCPPRLVVLLVLLLNCDSRSTVFAAGPQPRPSTPSVPCRTSTTAIHAQWSLPDLNHGHPRPVDLNRQYPRQVFPAGPHEICQIECQKICQMECQIECQKICQIKCYEICQIECQKVCQIKCQIE